MARDEVSGGEGTRAERSRVIVGLALARGQGVSYLLMSELGARPTAPKR